MVSPSTCTLTVMGCDELTGGLAAKLAWSCERSALREAASARAGMDAVATSGPAPAFGVESVSCCWTSVESGCLASHA